MRRPIALGLSLSLTLSGCAAHRSDVAHGADTLHDWASVMALPAGTPVRVTLDYGIDGRLDAVTDSTLIIQVPPGMHRLRFSRAGVTRLAVLTRKKMPWRWLGVPLAGGIIGGLVGGLAGAVMRDGKVAALSLGVFAASGVGWFYYLLTHHADHEWRDVYVIGSSPRA